MELTQWKLPHGTYTMEVTSWNLHNESYLMELTPLKLPNGTYAMEVTSWNLHDGMELRLNNFTTIFNRKLKHLLFENREKSSNIRSSHHSVASHEHVKFKA